MSYTYAYLTGCLILFFFWLLMFLLRKDLRREMLWASFWGMPLGFIDFFLVPHYWNPDSLFNLIKTYGVGIESFFFVFVTSGIASVAYEFLRKEKPVPMRRAGHSHFWLLIAIPCAFVILSLLFPSHAIYNLMAVGAAGALVIARLRRDLWKQIIASAFIFALLYFAVFVLIIRMFEGLVAEFYELQNMWGILILGVPLEEIVVAFFAGALWSTIYEYTKVYREKKLSRSGSA